MMLSIDCFFQAEDGIRHGHVAGVQTCALPIAGLVDHGDAVTGGEDLETGQAEAAETITTMLDAPGCQLAIVLGGGHETAWASYRGLMAAQRMAPRAGERPRWGVLNLDAHFDLRREDRPTSGTPFWQMAEAERRSEEHTSELQSRGHLVCRLLLEKKK